MAREPVREEKVNLTSEELSLIRAALEHLKSWQQTAFGLTGEPIQALLNKLNTPAFADTEPAPEPAPAPRKRKA